MCREKELDVDEEYDVDGGLDMYESRKKKGTKVRIKKKKKTGSEIFACPQITYHLFVIWQAYAKDHVVPMQMDQPALTAAECITHRHSCELMLDVRHQFHAQLHAQLHESQTGLCCAQEQQQKRDRSTQIADHRRAANAVDRCSLCFSSASRPRHLTVSLGQTAYLAIPAR